MVVVIIVTVLSLESAVLRGTEAASGPWFPALAAHVATRRALKNAHAPVPHPEVLT